MPDHEHVWEVVIRLNSEVRLLHEINAELLAALEAIFVKHAQPCFQGDPHTLPYEWEQVRAAIAKAGKE